MTSVERHLTASVFVVTEEPRPRLVLIRHAKFGRWMIPGGHVERDEAPDAAACREVLEETGARIRLEVPLASDEPGVCFLPTPRWVLDEQIPASGDGPPHVHVDLLYVATLPEAGIGDLIPGVLLAEREKITQLAMFPTSARLAITVLSEHAARVAALDGRVPRR